MEYIRKIFAGRSGKPCLTKIATFLWLITVITLISYLTIKNNAWPTVPDAVYYSIALVLGVKAYGDVKLNPPTPPTPPQIG